jgi:phosphatidylserine decarboxylase
MARRPRLSGSAAVSPLPRHTWELVKAAVPPMHAAGRPFVAGALTFGVFGWRHSWSRHASLLAAGALALCFREPARVPPTLAGALVAPADGRVVAVDESVPPVDLGLGDAPLPRVTIATSLVDPYVRRAPVAGQVTHLAEDGSSLVLSAGNNTSVALVHTVGPVGGRILSDVVVGDEVALGQAYGLVRFASRVEVLLPAGSSVLPLPGQRTVAGETVLAVLGG